MHGLFVVLVLVAEAPASLAPAGSIDWISPQPTGERLAAVWGSDSWVWAVGDGGAIVRSSDRGITWTRVDAGTRADLQAVWAADEKHVWAVGREGALLHSTDGGARWDRIDAHGLADLRSVWGSSRADVYVAGERGSILRTRDGGRSFQPQQPLGATDEVLDTLIGDARGAVYVAGARGSLLVSDERGEHWTALLQQTPARGGPSPRPRRGRQIWSLTSSAPDSLLAVMTTWQEARIGTSSSAILALSQDGGRHWQPSVVTPPPSAWPLFGPFSSSGRGTVYGVVTFDPDAPPAAARQGLVVSGDGGASFERRHLFDPPLLYGLWHQRSGVLVAVGAAGTILRSEDAGTSWAEQSRHPFGKDDLEAVWAGAGEVWAVGQNCTVVHSGDGGRTFQTVRPCPATGKTALTSVWGSTTGEVYLGGEVLYYTEDHGKHFRVVTPPSVAQPKQGWRGWGTSADDVYAAGCGVWHSSDHARSWRRIDGAASQSTCTTVDQVFGIPGEVFIHTPAGLARRSNRAPSWQIRTAPKLSSHFWELANGDLYAIDGDGRVSRSKDGALAWRALGSPLPAHAFPTAVAQLGDETYLLAAGARPPGNQTVLLRTGDHGETWTTSAVLPWACKALAVSPERQLWVAGWRGMLARIR